ncbi:MAG TPA: GntR family transcriptional regulator [Streptosporangiaceae bacterium]
MADRREMAVTPPTAARGSRRTARVSLPDACVRALTDAIERGIYPAGSPLPSENELADQLQVSRATLREALRTLEDRQLVVRRHGRGTFVSTAPIVNDLHRNFGITAMIRAAGYEPSTAGQEVTTGPAPRDAAERLGLARGETVTTLRRIRLADKRPVVLSVEVFPARLLTADDLARLSDSRQSLYGYLYAERGIAIHRGLAELTPVKAPAEIAAGLEVVRGSLLLCISQVDYDDTGKALMYSVEYHLPDWVRFTIERIGPGSAADD